MKVADWIVDYLIRQGCTDSFGIPGAVILDLLYAMDRRKPEFVPHLVYHEQGGAFAASGYAQASGKMGVAYGTRGPGFTNMVTGIADSYYDSLPVLFLTAHTASQLNPQMRILNNQEMDTVAVVKNITKYAARIDSLDELMKEVERACGEAISGRKGPVFLDILSSLFNQEINSQDNNINSLEKSVVKTSKDDLEIVANHIKECISKSQRPIFLIGNGIRDKNLIDNMRKLVEKTQIPVLSSRTAQDAFSFSPMYYGHIGSHATRYSNFILSKADLIISLGNRMAFPINSKSFRPIVEKTHILRIDIDDTEFQREIPGSENFRIDLHDLLPYLTGQQIGYNGHKEWLQVCDKLRKFLNIYDKNEIVDGIMNIMKRMDSQLCFVCDVGNNGFWVTNAYAYTGKSNKILYSGSFGTLGSAIPKSIGAYYATKHPVICFTGDQGLQMNSQELEFIGKEKLPISIVVLNNFSSGMIKEREDRRFNSKYVHTTITSGYSIPKLKKLAEAYQIEYLNYNNDKIAAAIQVTEPCIIEFNFSETVDLFPYLPIGDACQDLYPNINREIYYKLNNL